MRNEMFIHSKTFKNDGFRPITLGIKKYILGRYTLAKLPTSLFSTKGDAEHICDLDHPNAWLHPSEWVGLRPVCTSGKAEH